MLSFKIYIWLQKYVLWESWAKLRALRLKSLPHKQIIM